MGIDEYKENKEVVILGKQENGKMREYSETWRRTIGLSILK